LRGFVRSLRLRLPGKLLSGGGGKSPDIGGKPRPAFHGRMIGEGGLARVFGADFSPAVADIGRYFEREGSVAVAAFAGLLGGLRRRLLEGRVARASPR
jgi:hypothetical protein